jgi:hypothetical protein
MMDTELPLEAVVKALEPEVERLFGRMDRAIARLSTADQRSAEEKRTDQVDRLLSLLQLPPTASKKEIHEAVERLLAGSKLSTIGRGRVVVGASVPVVGAPKCRHNGPSPKCPPAGCAKPECRIAPINRR